MDIVEHFRNDELCSYEYNETQTQSRLAGEKYLWYKVLYQALEDYKLLYTQPETQEFKDIFDWFFNNPYNCTGSFIYICDILNIEKENILERLLKWSKRQYEMAM